MLHQFYDIGPRQVNSAYRRLAHLREVDEYTWTNGAWVADPNGVTRLIYDGMDVIQERDGSNAVTVNYTRAGNIGGLLARTVGTSNYYYHFDGSGNIVQLTNASGATVARYAYDAYGNSLNTDESGLTGGQPYRYSTKWLHGRSGLYNYGYRFYTPGLGRWMSRDPIG